MVPSSVPCTCSAATGSDGAQSSGSANVAPAMLATAAITSAWSQAIRYDMKPPLLWPIT